MNSLIDEYRRQFDDPRSDAEVLSVMVPWIQQNHPEELSNYPDALRDFKNLKPPEPPPPPAEPYNPDVGDYLKQGARSLVTGFTEGLASIPEGALTLKRGLREALPTPLKPLVQGSVDVLTPGESITPGGEPIGDKILAGIGKMLRSVGEAAAPDLVPELEKSWAATKIPAGVGSAASFMVGGVAGKALKIPSWLGIAGIGSLSTGQQMYDDAIATGADERTAFISSLIGNVVGTSEAVPLASIFNRIDKVSGGSFTKNLLKYGAIDSFEEAVQNSAQQLAQDYTAKQLYDKDRGIFDNFGEAAGVGGAVGFVVSAIASALNIKLGKKGGEPNGQEKGKQEKGNEVLKTPTAAGQDISDVAATYTLTPEEIRTAREHRAALLNAHPEIAETPAPTVDQAAVEAAAAKTDPNPTPAEKKSGKYEKGQVVLDTGITVDIENAAGSTRTGTDSDGETWNVTMPATYGEILGVKGKDKDYLDIYLGPDVTLPNVYVVNQNNPETGKFDEHKIFYGFSSPEQVAATYNAAFSDNSGLSRLGNITAFTKPEFMTWLKDGDKNVPAVNGEKAPVTPQVFPASAPIEAAPPSQNAALVSKAATTRVDLSPEEIADLQGAIEQEFVPTLSRMAAFEKASVAGESETGKGKKAAPAFEETGDKSRLMADATAGAKAGDYGKSRKLGVFESKDGTHYVVTTAYDTNSPKVFIDGVGVSLAAFLKRGYKLVASVKTTEPSKGFYEKLTPDQWEQERESLRERQRQNLASVAEEVSQVITETPADQLAAKEGFTKDEATALWKALGHLKPAELHSHLFRVTGDALDALAKIFTEFEKAGLNEIDSSKLAIEYVKTALQIANGSQTAFTDAIGKAVGYIADENNKEIQDLKGRKSGTAAKSEGKPAGGNAKEGGGRTEPRKKPGAEGKGEGVRNRSPEYRVARQRSSNEQVRQKFLSALEGLEAAGISVTQIYEEVNGLVADAGGYYTPAGKSIVLYTADSMHPSRDNYMALLHEAGEAVLADESPERQQMLHLALASAADEDLGIAGWVPTVDQSMSASEQELLANHDRLAEAVARKLEANGFNAAEARGLWQSIVRWLRDLWYRVAMAVQSARFGQDHINLQTAEGYFTNRLISMLAGDNSSYSFMSWLGGPKYTGGQASDMHAKANGSDELGERFDPETGTMIYSDVIDDSPEATTLNTAIRFRKPELITAPVSDVSREPDIDDTAYAAVKVAAQNEVKGIWRAAYDEWNAKGGNSAAMTFDQWWNSGNFVSLSHPDEMITLQNNLLQAAGKPQANPATRLGDVPLQMQARIANAAFKMTLDEQARQEAKVKEYSWNLNPTNKSNLNDQLARRATQLTNMMTRYDDLDYMAGEARQIMGAMLREAETDAKDIKNVARKDGALMQAIKSIEGEMDDNLGQQYISAINRLYKRWSSSEERSRSFADTLQAAANTEIINWSTDSPVLIKTKLLDAARANPALAHLLEPSMDRRAELAMLAAFGRKNFDVMTLLEMRRKATAEEKTTIAQAVKTAMGTHKAAIAEAKTAVSKLVRYSVAAGRLIDSIAEARLANRNLLDRIEREEGFIQFHWDTAPVVRARIDEMGRIIGSQSEDWEAHDGATLKVPANPNDPPERWETKKIKLRENGTSGPEINEWIKNISARLEAIPQASWGTAERTLDVQKRKLEYIQMRTTFDPMRSNIVTNMIGSITDKLAGTGHPAAKAAADMIHRIAAFAGWDHRSQQVLGSKWSRTEGELMSEASRILGRKVDMDSFRDLTWNPAMKLFENRSDIWANAPDDATATRNAISALRLYFQGSAETQRLANDPRFWAAMERHIYNSKENNQFLIKAAKAMGRKIEDLGYFRDPIGSALNFMPRRWRRTTEKLWQSMVEKWGGTNNEKFGRWVSNAYTTDPNALRTEVASRLTPTTWDQFVRAIVHRPGRSGFYAPVDDEYKPLAARENMIRAFETATPGDLVGLAENLHSLESASLPGKPIMAIEDYVAETLSTFQNFFGILHNEFSGQANANQKGLPRPNRILLNARVSDEAPSEWLDFMPMDSQSIRLAVRSMAFQFGGGRDLEAIRTNFQTAHKEFVMLDEEYQALRNKWRDAGKTGSALREAMATEAEATGGSGHLIRMENAAKNARVVDSMARSFDAMVKNQLDIPMELRTFIELIGTVAGMTVQGPGTALQDLSYLFIQPFRQMGLTKEAFERISSNAKSVIEALAGSMAWNLRLQLNLDTEDNTRFHEMGWDDSDATMNMMQKVQELYHEQLFLNDPDGRSIPARISLKAQRGIKIAGRIVRAALGSGFTGFKRGSETEFAYPTFKPLSPFTMTTQFQHFATVKGMWKFVRPRVVKAIQYLEAHPADFDDPAFKFKAKDLGMSHTAFDYITARMAENGMSFEALGRDAIRRRVADPTAPPLLPEHYRLLGVMGTNETVMESNLTTRMPGFLTNPALAAAAPLVGWGFQATNIVAKQADPILQAKNLGEAAKATWSFLLPYAAVLPVSIAFALWREWFDENVIGKKANVQGFGQNNDFLAMIEKAGRTSVFGVAGDAINSFVNTDTNRPFSVDSRVLFLSSLFGLGRATSTWIKQGSFDYASVGRPYITALGGSGFLQQVDMINHALTASGSAPLVEAEAKIVARINVQNYLRAGGRTLDMDVRTGTFGAQSSLPTPAKPYIGQMVLAAYVNDPQGFAEARREAIITRMRTERVPLDKAEDYVKRSYEGMDPLTVVFKTKPSEDEFRRLLVTLGDDGRIAVMTAMRNYNHYGELLGIEPSYGKRQGRQTASATIPSFRSPSLMNVRRQAMGAR